MPRLHRRFVVILVVIAAALAAVARTNPAAQPEMVVAPDRVDAVYGVGDSVRWTVEWKGASNAPAAAKYVLKRDGLKEVGAGELTFSGGRATIESKFDQPGAMLVEVSWPDANGQPGNRAFGGAVAAPRQIKPAVPKPQDFDAFWKSKIR